MIAGSLVALITPMRLDGAIDFDAYSRVLDFHERGGTAGVVLAGTTGESVCLEDAEIHALVEHAVRQVGGRMRIVVGAGQSGTAATIERARAFSALPVDALLIVTPAYNRPTQQGLYEHFRAVAGASRVPIILYNVPSRTAVDLLPETTARLARLPGICGIKEAVGDPARTREILVRCPPEFVLLSGDDASSCDTLLAGARGVISVTSNVAPELVAQMVAAAMRGDAEAARTTDARLAALNRDLFLEVNPIPVKWAAEELGIIEGGIRLPLTRLSPQHHDRVRAAMRAAGITLPAARRSV